MLESMKYIYPCTVHVRYLVKHICRYTKCTSVTDNNVMLSYDWIICIS